MKIYLAQHGNQNPEEVDPEEGLSEEGISDVEKVGEFAAKIGIKPTKIYHSVKTRAKQTAERFQNHLGGEISELEGMKPMDEVAQWKEKLEDGLMMVGHLPFMQKFSSLLLVGDENAPCIKFHQGGILGLEQNEDGKWEVDFFLIP